MFTITNNDYGVSDFYNNVQYIEREMKLKTNYKIILI